MSILVSGSERVKLTKYLSRQNQQSPKVFVGWESA